MTVCSNAHCVADTDMSCSAGSTGDDRCRCGMASWCASHVPTTTSRHARRTEMAWKRQPTASARVTTGSKWKRVRTRVLKDDNHICQRCGEDATHVDHTQPLAEHGDPYDTDNLQSLCVRCHGRKTAREGAAASAAARRKRNGKRPTPVHPSDCDPTTGRRL
jgi:5-methylcytosine-specific restriction endonuclease McrA